MRGHRILGLMLCAFLVGLLLPLFVHAEAPLQEFSLIEPLDATKFPNVTLRVAPILADGTAPVGVAKEAFRIQEDNATREVASLKPVTVGAQVAVIVDAATTNFALGATGKALKDEYCEAVKELVSGQWLSQAEPKDQMMLIMPDPESSGYKVIEPWTTDLMRIYNATVTYPYDKKKDYTLLYGMLVEAIQRMKELPNYVQRPKFVLIFSDWLDMKETWGQVDDVIARANEAKVIIISVVHGPKGTVCKDKMTRLCVRTGGMCTWYDNPEAMSVPYNLLKLRRGQYELSYRSALCQSGKHELKVTMQYAGRELWASGTLVVPELPAPSVRLVEPVAGARITRQAPPPPCYRRELQEVEPREQTISYEIAWTWPDGSPRQVTKVSYIVDGVTMATLPPDQAYTWDISGSKPGVEKHSLQVRVADECGASGESEPVQVEVETILNEFKPPQVSIVEPPAEKEYVRKAGLFGPKIESLKPKEQVVRYEVSWPDGCERTIREVYYIVNKVTLGKLPPNQDFTWDFSSARPGREPYELQVKVCDEWGYCGESEPVKVVVVTQGPPDLGKIAAFVFAALALGVAAYVGIKRPQVVQVIGSTMAGAYDKTIGRLVPRKPGQPRGAVAARAYLVPILSDGSEGQPIAIRFFPSLVGRDATRCQITFSDPTVSRLHARITEEIDGVFKICDEGSTGGTYVNGQEVGTEGFVLANNDRIELGNLVVIFRQPSEETQPMTRGSTSTDTTVASRRARKAPNVERSAPGEAEALPKPEQAEGEDSTVPYVKKD